MRSVNRATLRALMEREQHQFVGEHPRSARAFEQAGHSLLYGVPMNWMTRWAGPYPVFVERGEGAHFVDIDGHEYIDLCLGDTGAMSGHAPKETVDAIVAQATRGTTFMLPTENAMRVGEEMTRRFGLPYWQFSLTATDANRFAIRLAREITGRNKILVHNWCYHGSVDETIATITDDGTVGPRHGNVGPPVDPAVTTKVVEFNDVDALVSALAPGDVACVLAEPALTNIGIVLPEPGYHDALREATRQTGTLLIIDETHTICTGPGGYTRAHGLEPDLITIGKPIAGGVPAAAFGLSDEVARLVIEHTYWEQADIGGIGGTLAGNALSIAAMRATLERVLTEDAYARMIALGDRFTAGVETVIREHELPWHVTQLGCRAEYRFRPNRPSNGAEAAAATDDELDAFMHLYALNRGILLTPFHNMALMSPATSPDDVDLHTEVFAEAAAELLG